MTTNVSLCVYFGHKITKSEETNKTTENHTIINDNQPLEKNLNN